jgi:N-acetylmuramoyl-L-alanine amidase
VRARSAALASVLIAALLGAWAGGAGSQRAASSAGSAAGPSVASARAGEAAGAPLIVERVGQGQIERLPTRVFDGQPYISALQLARLVGASLHWRADVRKLVLRNVKHTLKFTVDVRFAVFDETEVLQLSGPVRQSAGEVYVPLTTVPTVLSGRFIPQARLTPGRLLLVADEPDAGPPEVAVEGAVTRLTLPAKRPLAAGLVSARAGRFTVRIPGAHLAPVPGDTLGPGGLIDYARFGREPGNLWMELRLSPESRGYRLRSLRAPDRVELEVTSGLSLPPGFVELAPEFGRGAARPLRLLVLDAGHGGADSGYVAAPGLREKDLTLRLALAVRDLLQRRQPALEVQLTRDSDRSLPPPERVELANRARADLFLSLHLDGVPGTAFRGVTAYVAPPLGLDPEMLLAGEETPTRGRSRPRPVLLVGWQRAAGRHHAEARTAADLRLASLAADGCGPTRRRVVPTYVTEGADCPAVMLECGSLSLAEERLALTGGDGLRKLAESITRAIERYAQGGVWP